MNNCIGCGKELSVYNHRRCKKCNGWQISKGMRIDEANAILKDAIKKIEALGVIIETYDGIKISNDNFPNLAIDDCNSIYLFS